MKVEEYSKQQLWLTMDYTNFNTWTLINWYSHIIASKFTYTYTYTHTYTHTLTHTYIHTHNQTKIHFNYLSIRVGLHIKYNQSIVLSPSHTHTQTHTHTHTHTHIYIHSHIYTRITSGITIRVHEYKKYVCKNVCVYEFVIDNSFILSFIHSKY